MKNTGDVAKALAAGADLVMTGHLFKDCFETSHQYNGSASETEYMLQGKNGRAPEGVETVVENGLSVSLINKNIREALQSAFSYVGAKSVSDFQSKAELIQVSGKSKVL
jgi:IMP dehydrogenase